MSRNLVLPFFPVAPQDYDQRFMDEVVRAFSVYLQQMQNPGEGRNTQLVLTNLKTDDVGLETGALFPSHDPLLYQNLSMVSSGTRLASL